MYEDILLAVDGSDAADRATDRALQLAAEHGGRVHVLSVIDTVEAPEPALSSVELVTDALQDDAMAALAGVAGEATARGVDVDTRLSHGVPQREIMAEADAVDADLIVMGVRGRSRRRGQGNVVRRVRRGTDREVEVVD